MTSGSHFSRTAKSAINRFYDNADTRHLATLQEAVPELYLAESEKKAAKLWEKVDFALGHLKQVEAVHARKILESRDVKGLAELVAKLQKVK